MNPGSTPYIDLEITLDLDPASDVDLDDDIDARLSLNPFWVTTISHIIFMYYLNVLQCLVKSIAHSKSLSFFN